jgi:hypothetical protein
MGPLLALALAALPSGEARYRVEIAGEPVGAATLAVVCPSDACRVRWETHLRLPDAAGGAISLRRVELEVDPGGRARAGPIRHFRDGERWTAEARAGRVPASLAEVVLLARGSGCVPVFEEETLEEGEACHRGRGGGTADVDVDVLGTRERVRQGRRGFPDSVEVPEQGVRFVLDASAAVPVRPPRLFGVRVPGPRDPASARLFCGTPVDPAPRAPAPPSAPAPEAPGASCRDKAEAYLARAASAGLRGRTAVGVAWDGDAFVWHAWAELEDGQGGFVPVDPSFRELPARGPRFTLARYATTDRAARVVAGRRILACWGRAGVTAR